MLRPYMGFSISAGSEEGAVLVFAHSVREARKIGFAAAPWLDAEYLDFGARLIPNASWLLDEADKDKLALDVPHATDNPRACDVCECWGHSPIGEDGLCDECRAAKEDQ